MKKIYKLTKGKDTIEGTIEFICAKLNIPESEFIIANRLYGSICGYTIKKLGLEQTKFSNAEEVADFKKRWKAMQEKFKDIKWDKK